MGRGLDKIFIDGQQTFEFVTRDGNPPSGRSRRGSTSFSVAPPLGIDGRQVKLMSTQVAVGKRGALGAQMTRACRRAWSRLRAVLSARPDITDAPPPPPGGAPPPPRRTAGRAIVAPRSPPGGRPAAAAAPAARAAAGRGPAGAPRRRRRCRRRRSPSAHTRGPSAANGPGIGGGL